MAATRTATGVLQSLVLGLVILGLVLVTILALSALINPPDTVDSATAEIGATSGSDGAEIGAAPGPGSAPDDSTTDASIGSATGMSASTATGLVVGSTSAAGVSCGRGASSEGRGPFFVAVDDSALWAEELAVGVDLIDDGQGRHSRVVQIGASDGSRASVVAVADSEDASRYIGCTITAVQRGEQVIITGN